MTGTRIALLSLAIAAGMLGTTLRAEAQFRVGGTLGVVFDNPDDMLALGAEARYRFTNPRWAFQPRFTYLRPSVLPGHVPRPHVARALKQRAGTSRRPRTGA